MESNYFYNIIVVFAIHWHESAMGIHVVRNFKSSNIEYSIINCSHHAIHYIFRTHSSYNLKFVPFDHLHQFPPLLIPASTSIPTCYPWQLPTCSLFLWIQLFGLHIYVRSHSICLCLSIMPSSFIHVVTKGGISLLCIAE